MTEEQVTDCIGAFDLGIRLLNSTTKKDKESAKRIVKYRDELMTILLTSNPERNGFLLFLGYSYSSQKVFISRSLVDRLPQDHMNYIFEVDESLPIGTFRPEEYWDNFEGKRTSKVLTYNWN